MYNWLHPHTKIVALKENITSTDLPPSTSSGGSKDLDQTNSESGGLNWHFLACVLMLLDCVKLWPQFGCGHLYGL